MEKELKYLIIVLAYIVVITLIFNFASSPQNNTTDANGKQYSGTHVSVGVQDSVAVSVTRPRSYGTYYETAYQNGKVVTLYILNIQYLKVPIEAYSFNFVFIHILFIVLLSGYIFIERRQKNEKNISSVNNNSN